MSEARAPGATFAPDDAAALRAQDWHLVALPAGLTLAGLRATGAPFKGPRYFATHAASVAERTTVATDLAYKPGLVPGSFNRTIEAVEPVLAALNEVLPAGVMATLAPTAAYVWLFEAHRAASGEYPFAQLYTWTVDRYQERANLVVGLFGQREPIVVTPQVEGRGSGVGVWPVVVPRAVATAGWPLAPTP